ncbi:hypothetical protein Tco_1405504 [Tanacetum coccineum]
MQRLTYLLGQTPNCLAGLSRVQETLSKFRHAARSTARLFDMKTQREVQLATEINNLTRQLLGSIDERRSFIRELEQHLLTNVIADKTREDLKGLHKDDMIKAMEMRMVALQLHHQAMKGVWIL